ncbi:MAG TPA: hypothetical protein VFV96_05925 [Verrucomicrobiae bacterium]|nr:hypothetical protein [Verrucomicrobiae bacterium]
MAKVAPFANTIVRGIKPLQPNLETRRRVCPAGKAAKSRRQNGTRNRGRSFDWPIVLTEPAPRPPNLLILGASGHVAQAFLQRLAARWRDFGRVVLLDLDDGVRRNPYLDHESLNYEFVQRRLRFPDETMDYHRLLRQHGINVVLDVTDLDTQPVLNATDAAGVSYVNTALNESGRGIAEVVSDLHPTRTDQRQAPHILSSGMNPGVVNLWVWHGFQQHGTPLEIVHFEYDTSVPATGWRPMITWSRKEFLTETVWEPAGQVVNGALRMCSGNAVQHREDLRSIMQPLIELQEYPRGMLVLHEENVKLGSRLGASSRYVYAIHPRTMAYMEQLLRQRGRVEIGDLELGDNTSIPLAGSDTIGVCLRYADRRVYYLNSLANSEVTGTNATCAQVAVGADAALHALFSERLAPRIYFASDLYDTVYSDVVFGALRVEHFVFEKLNGSLVQRLHIPQLRPTLALIGDTLAA